MSKIFKILTVATLSLCVIFSVGMAVAPNNTQSAYAAVYQQGSSGATVKTIQKKLKNWGYYKGAVDGIYDSQTREAVKYFQRKNGLKVDGVVGAQTLKALGINDTSSSTNTGGSSS